MSSAGNDHLLEDAFISSGSRDFIARLDARAPPRPLPKGQYGSRSERGTEVDPLFYSRIESAKLSD
jgi:hypothetical protein